MHSFDLILTLTGGLAAALVFGYFTQRVGLSPIVGYLLAGVAVGPKPAMFEKFLPYAMALGVEDNWAKAFDGIYNQPPSWYSGPGGVTTFRPSAFRHNLGVMSTAAAATMSSAPRSSGGSGFRGGSSGGGFGGGGGGF